MLSVTCWCSDDAKLAVVFADEIEADADIRVEIISKHSLVEIGVRLRVCLCGLTCRWMPRLSAVRVFRL